MSFFSIAKADFTASPFTIPEQNAEMLSRKRKCDELSAHHFIKKPRFNKDHYDAADILPVDLSLSKFNHNDTEKRKAFWYYILGLLMDTQNKNVLAWTGKGREFFIHDHNELTEIWCRYQGNEKVKWQSVLRLFRLQTERGIISRLGPRGGHQAMLLFAFITEPSVHIDYTREQLDQFIADNKVAQPTGISIYPSSTRSPSKISSTLSSRSTPSSTTSSSDGSLTTSESPDSVTQISIDQPIQFMVPSLFPFYTIPDMFSPYFALPTLEEKRPVAQHKFSIDSILGL